MSFQPPKGTDDIVAPESLVWSDVLRAWGTWADRFGFPLILTPILEATDLFERGVGESTEVVTKQMYTFTDRGGRSMTLRPEGTAGVVRAFLNSGSQGPWKGAYSGPMFRYEQPQAGRRRQFWQVGVEYLDVEGPAADSEVIELGYRFLSSLQVPAVEVVVNSLGDPACRPQYLEVLRQYLEERRSRLCADSQQLIDRNPLRVLDCKTCEPVVADAPVVKDHLCDPCQRHYDTVRSSLNQVGVPFVEDGRLVRGLDYYTRTAFEYVATGLDTAQNAVGGGGRYDGLAEAIGGRRAPGVGLAMGVDRIVLASNASEPSPIDVYVVSESTPEDGLVVASSLRQRGLRVDFDPEGRSVKAQFRAAGRSGAPAVVIFHDGDQDVSTRIGEERVELRLSDVASWLRERL
ncbi:MAG: histidine--tRNA ligase [Acidimicrobiia bacterium]